MTDSLTAIAVGDSGYAIRTTDGGSTWLPHASQTGNTLFGIAFGDPLTGAMVGAGGTILRTRSGGLPVGVERLAHPALPEKFTLEQNYPNPFNGTTTVQFSLALRSRVRLSVYDLLGQHVATLVDAELGPGVHRVPFGSGLLSSGVYLYSLSVDGFRATRKLLHLK